MGSVRARGGCACTHTHTYHIYIYIYIYMNDDLSLSVSLYTYIYNVHSRKKHEHKHTRKLPTPSSPLRHPLLQCLGTFRGSACGPPRRSHGICGRLRLAKPKAAMGLNREPLQKWTESSQIGVPPRDPFFGMPLEWFKT